MNKLRDYENSILNIPRQETGHEHFMALTECEAIKNVLKMPLMDYFAPFDKKSYEKMQKGLALNRKL